MKSFKYSLFFPYLLKESTLQQELQYMQQDLIKDLIMHCSLEYLNFMKHCMLNYFTTNSFGIWCPIFLFWRMIQINVLIKFVRQLTNRKASNPIRTKQWPQLWLSCQPLQSTVALQNWPKQTHSVSVIVLLKCGPWSFP